MMYQPMRSASICIVRLPEMIYNRGSGYLSPETGYDYSSAFTKVLIGLVQTTASFSILYSLTSVSRLRIENEFL